MGAKVDARHNFVARLERDHRELAAIVRSSFAPPVEPLAPQLNPGPDRTSGEQQQDRREVGGEDDKQRHL